MIDNMFYVYGLVDPRNGMVFYIGKGTGYRDRSHLTEAKRSKIVWSNAIKCERISSIWAAGYNVLIQRYRENLSEHEALRIEGEMILSHGLLLDGTGTLTNVVKPHEERKIRGDKKRKTRQLIQYNMNGVTICSYTSASAAANQTGIRISGILKCCNGDRNHAGGFRWSYEDEPIKEIKPCEYHISRKRPILQTCITTKHTNVYPSIKEAAIATGIDAAGIIACCKKYKSNHTRGGYKWSYFNDDIN